MIVYVKMQSRLCKPKDLIANMASRSYTIHRFVFKEASMLTILTSSATTASNLNAAFSVEAEFGSILVEGSNYTLAHHEAGKEKGYERCPCLNGNHFTKEQIITSRWDKSVPENWDSFCLVAEATEICVVSHVDWDTLGGVLSLTGDKPQDGMWDKVWALIAHNDENGIHKTHEHRTDINTWIITNAMYAWLSLPENRIFAPRDGSTLNISEFITKVKMFLIEVNHDAINIMVEEPECYGHLSTGIVWANAQTKIETESYVDAYGFYTAGGPCWGEVFSTRNEWLDCVKGSDTDNASGTHCVLLRSSESFVNHLYTVNQDTHDAVVGYNTKTKAITLSFEKGKNSRFSACEIMQEIFGELAGGHHGIAGTPRDKEYSINDAAMLARVVVSKLTNEEKKHEKINCSYCDMDGTRDACKECDGWGYKK